MSLADENSRKPPVGGRWFVTTHWNVVLAAGETGSRAAAAALETLCRMYWYPLYAFVRRKGHDPDTPRTSRNPSSHACSNATSPSGPTPTKAVSVPTC